MEKSLHKQNNTIADPKVQLEHLSNGLFKSGTLNDFRSTLVDNNIDMLRASDPEILQVNVGYMCNQVCKHCHVDAGPDRKEIMSRETMTHCLDVLRQNDSINTLDLTGGAPEMNPDFRWFVEESRKAKPNLDIIVRSNLTIILANPKYHDLPEFFKKNNIHVVSSLPYYKAAKTDNQRGKGVFSKSIEALILLNKQGYGMPDSQLQLDLVYNPAGAFLPADQSQLEAEYKRELFNEFGIQFHSLFALTNIPVNRFLEYLIRSGNYEDYMTKLVNAFNPATIEGLMCLNTLSIDYQGYIYDCDFNQMLDLGSGLKDKLHVSSVSSAELKGRIVKTSQHCYGCTAGAGSSCQGTLS